MTSGNPDERVMVHVSYYSAQIAAFDQDYIKKLAGTTAYIEEPFCKLVMRAAASNGTDLVFLDAHPYSAAKIKSNPDVVFAATFTTRYSAVWKEGSPLAAQQTIHREDVCQLPWAMNASREICQLAEHIFEGFPPLDVTMGTTNLPMLLEYVQLSENGAVALFDSFSFIWRSGIRPSTRLGCISRPFLRRVPWWRWDFCILATPSSLCARKPWQNVSATSWVAVAMTSPSSAPWYNIRYAKKPPAFAGDRKGKNHVAFHWYCRPAQRGQVHPVHRPHQQAGPGC